MIEDDERMPAGWPLDDATAEYVPDASPYVPTVGDILDAIKEGRLTRDTPLKLLINHTGQSDVSDLAYNLFNIAYDKTGKKPELVIVVESREFTPAELYGEEEEPATATDAHANEITDTINRKSGYHCPECGEPNPTNVQPGDCCDNCDYVYVLPALATTDEHEEED